MSFHRLILALTLSRARHCEMFRRELVSKLLDMSKARNSEVERVIEERDKTYAAQQFTKSEITGELPTWIN